MSAPANGQDRAHTEIVSDKVCQDGIPMRSTPRFAVGFSLAVVLITLAPENVPAAESFQLIPGVRSRLGMQSGYVWLRGEALIPAGGRPGSGSRVDLTNDLGVDQADVTNIVLDSVIGENHLVDFGYMRFSPTGFAKVKRSFIFQNRTYSKGTELETKLDFNWLYLAYGYKLLSANGLFLAPAIGVHHIRHAITLNGATKEEAMTSNTRSLDGTYPVLGLESGLMLPYGMDLSLSLEGVHLVTRGYVGALALRATWEVMPDVVIGGGCYGRFVHYLEDNQRLNNEWSYETLIITAGAAVTF